MHEDSLSYEVFIEVSEVLIDHFSYHICFEYCIA